MSVNDLIDEQDQLKAHRWTFSLWPRQWTNYNLPYLFNWKIYRFQLDEVENIPNKPGIYSFVIQPEIASHPYCAYLMYIGKTKRTLQQRFREYLRERENVERGRPKILQLLNKYQGYLYFCCSTMAETEQITEIENALISAFLPPCNSTFPAEIRPVIGAFQ